MVTVLSLPAAATGGFFFFFLPSPCIDPLSVAQSCTEIWDQAGAGAELTAEVYPALPWQAFPAGSSQAHVNYSNVPVPEELGTPRIDPASQHLQPSASCPTWVGGRTLPTRGSQGLRKTAPAIWGQSGENVQEPQLPLPAPGSDTELPVTFTALSKSQGHLTFRWGTVHPYSEPKDRQ